MSARMQETGETLVVGLFLQWMDIFMEVSLLSILDKDPLYFFEIDSIHFIVEI